MGSNHFIVYFGWYVHFFSPLNALRRLCEMKLRKNQCIRSHVIFRMNVEWSVCLLFGVLNANRMKNKKKWANQNLVHNRFQKTVWTKNRRMNNHIQNHTRTKRNVAFYGVFGTTYSWSTRHNFSFIDFFSVIFFPLCDRQNNWTIVQLQRKYNFWV